MRNSNLYKKLIENYESDFYGFHMPGHKRNFDEFEMINPYSFDITEIEGFDNLHSPEGIIKQEMDMAKEFYGSEKTYFLINGSSAGNLAAISAVVQAGEKIIVGRNSHKSVYNGIELNKIRPVYVYPKIIKNEDIMGSYDLEEVENIIINNQDAKAVVLTSPTYEGVVSDVEAICKIAHKYSIPVIVDAAHGAHFNLSEKFPKSAIESGADVVIESLHKTLPSLTQTAVLHYKSKLIDRTILEKYLAMYQTSSPSYVLMASICNCLSYCTNKGKESADSLIDLLEEFKNKSTKLKNMRILNLIDYEEVFDADISKIIIFIDKGLTGIELKKILNEKYHLEMEMASGNYVIAMTSVADSKEGFERLINALLEIDRQIDIDKDSRISKENCKCIYIGNLIYDVDSNDNYDHNYVVSDKYIYMYPPGIPLVIPGEKISEKMRQDIIKYKEQGYEIIETI